MTRSNDPEATYTTCLICGVPANDCDCFDCYSCGVNPCECPDDDGWHDDYDIDGCRVFDAHGYLSRDRSHNRAGHALHLALDQQDEPTRATIRAIGRTLSPVGAPLGGYPRQRRLRKLRAMQVARKLRCCGCGKRRCVRGCVPF